MSDAAYWFVQTVQAELYRGASSLGDQYATAVTVACWIEDGNHLVRDQQGAEVVSSAIVYAAASDAANLPVGSRVTIPGRAAATRVITLERYESGSLDLGLDHVAAHLQ